MTKSLKLADIAKRIDAHLKRFEADPVINLKYTEGHRKGLHPYYLAMACPSGNRVWISYVNWVPFQGGTGLTKTEALEYLAWLDAGNVGSHWRMN